MLEIRHARSIRGSVDMPPSPDALFLSAVVALTAQAPVRIGPVADTALNAARRQVFGGLRTVDTEGALWRIALAPDADPHAPWRLPDDRIPWRDFCVATVLGMGREIRFGRVSAGRIDAWKSTMAAFGCPLEARLEGEGAALRLVPSAAIASPSTGCVSPNEIYLLLGLALGRGAKVSFVIDHIWSSPLRHLLPAFGYTLSIKSNAAGMPEDPLERRMRYLQRKKRTDETATFTVVADFSRRPYQELHIDLPGDETLVSLLVAAKSIVQKGALVINNACLESWALQNLDFVRKMGCRPAIQETRTTAFGSAGMLQLQEFILASRKMSCVPLCHVTDHLPSMLVTAAFAQGQSVFRDLGDLHNDTPDGLRTLAACLERMGVRLGEMPDGLVIDGGRDLDGFDMPDAYVASLSGACAIAGLGCMGATTVEDAGIMERWPDFAQILGGICEHRN